MGPTLHLIVVPSGQWLPPPKTQSPGIVQCPVSNVSKNKKSMNGAASNVRKTTKIRNRYNQVKHLTQDTTLESDKNTIKHKNESQEVSSFPAGDHNAAMNRSADWKALQIHDINNTNDPQKNIALERSVIFFSIALFSSLNSLKALTDQNKKDTQLGCAKLKNKQ